jgi:Fe2+ or Zn2+ uptake regulation protein
METVFTKIRSAGGRVTKLKRAIVEILTEHGCHLSRQEIIHRLKKKDMHPDRSTLYREFQFLVQNEIIEKNILGDTEYYEIPNDHHHHLVCLKCEDIQKIHLQNHLQQEEKELAARNNFRITKHSLDFYGYCQKCQT